MIIPIDKRKRLRYNAVRIREQAGEQRYSRSYYQSETERPNE